MSIQIANIDIDLSTEGLNRAIAEIQLLAEKLQPAMTQLIEELVKQGIDIAKAELFAFDNPAFDTGALHDSINGGMLDSDTGVVTTGVMYAVYVEYGTGFYASNGSGNQNGWVYYDTRLGKFRHTWGMAPRPFMYNTFRSLERYAEDNGGRLLAQYLS